jgi:hypothetical protein
MTARIKGEQQLADALHQLMAAARSDPRFPNGAGMQFLSTMLDTATANIDLASTRYNAAAEKYNSLLAAFDPQSTRSFAPSFRSTVLQCHQESKRG